MFHYATSALFGLRPFPNRLAPDVQPRSAATFEHTTNRLHSTLSTAFYKTTKQILKRFEYTIDLEPRLRYAQGEMGKPKPTDLPGTMAGRVIARLDEIEQWFRAGFKTNEVVAKLRADGITLHRVNISQILARFGISESNIRRSMAISVANGNHADEVARGSVAVPRPVVTLPVQTRIPRPAAAATKARKPAEKTEAVKTAPSGKPSSPSEDLKRKDQNRVEFKPNPRPRKEELI